MNYRYYINDIEVFPKGEWSIKYQRNEGQIFFRRIFDGELTFGGADYDFIISLDCEIATFDIYCKEEIFWQGQFQFPYVVKFDSDSCVVIITPEVVDEYSCIMNQYDTDFYLNHAGSITPQLWTCPAPGALVRALGPAWPLIGNSGVPTADYFSHILLGTDALGCDFNIRSSFMLNDNFANGDNYAAVYGIYNYITGANNRLPYVYIIKNPAIRTAWGGSACDGYLMYNFKMLEDLLRNAFNAYWFIDENGDFRVEHIHYFDPDFPHSDFTVGHDLTTLIDRNGRSYAYRRNKYEYETGRMYDQEIWTWQHFEGTEGTIPHNTEFEGLPVYYGAGIDQKSDYIPGEFKEKEHACPQFWTDVDWGEQLVGAGTVDTISCNGFLMVDVDITTAPNYKVFCEVGLLSGVSIANGHLSTENLLEHYHTYNRIFINGDMNNGNVTVFDTAQKHKLQDTIEFPICCDEDFDPLNRIRTELGDGEVKAATQTQHSLEVELWHEFDCE